MNPSCLFRFLPFILMVLWFLDGHAQYILAGQHQPGHYFVDLVPDTTLVGPNTHIPPLPAARFQIDIDGDSISDFELHSLGFWMNGGGHTEISIRSHRSDCQVALGYLDSCQLETAGSLQVNDTINNTLVWADDTILYLSHSSWSVGDYWSCMHNGFVNDTLGNYLAVRVNHPTDTLYGWIKVTNIDWSAYTVQEFACSREISGTEDRSTSTGIYPNPFCRSVTINSPEPGFNLVVYNQSGVIVISRKLLPGSSTIDLNDCLPGIYLFNLYKDDRIITKKLIKSKM